MIIPENVMADPITVKRGQASVDQETVDRFIQFYRDRIEHYGFDSRVPENVTILARYFARYIAGNIEKGLAIMGDTGLGKTFAMSIMVKLFGIRLYCSRDLTTDWQKYDIKTKEDFWGVLKGYPQPGTWPNEKYEHCWKDIIIDDIGTEPTLNDFGTKYEVMDYIMDRRVRDFESNQAFTFLTFNLPLTNEKNDENCVMGRYGKRFYSRLHQICHVVDFKGEDRRVNG
jgi:DNA replication protein DnaC